MTTRVLAICVAFGIFAFVGAFFWATMRPSLSLQSSFDEIAPSATASKTLSDGRLDMKVYAIGNQDIRLEIKFFPVAINLAAVEMRPDINFAMAEMHMDGITPPLQLVETGLWRSDLRLPMAGQWLVSVGIGDEFAEMEFNAP